MKRHAKLGAGRKSQAREEHRALESPFVLFNLSRLAIPPQIRMETFIPGPCAGGYNVE